VVWLPGTPSGAGSARLVSQDKRFAPHVAVVPRGASLSFPNLDAIYHNVFSTTPGQSFDMGLYRRGASRERRFDSAGLVSVYCNIHPQMAAYIRVVDGAWALTGANGEFALDGVAPGRYSVHVWHERGGEREMTTQVRAQAVSEIRLVLDASRYQSAAHKNKHGEDYPPAALDDDRY
jgi:plastocyanin